VKCHSIAIDFHSHTFITKGRDHLGSLGVDGKMIL